MTVQPAFAPTRAEERLLALAGDTSDPVRKSAADAFALTGLPHRRMETWKYTDLRSLMRDVAPLGGAADPAILDLLSANDPLDGVDRARIVVVDGIYRPDRSDLAGLDGVTVSDVAGTPVPEREGPIAVDPVVLLNTALGQGGVNIEIAPDTRVAAPIEIAFVTASASATTVAPRVKVTVGRHAEASLVETFRSADGVAHQVNVVADVVLDDGARLTWTRAQLEGDATQHLASAFVTLQRNATLNHLAVNAGAALWRWQGAVRVAGEGAHVGFHAATMLSGEAHGDARLVLTHAVGHATSKELVHNVVDGRAKGAFQGLIEVNRDAQKTDARMMIQTLLLSDSAEFAAKPELEIFADDVQCGHGSTSGQIDANHLFYLMARGIPRAEAEQLLLEGFLVEPIDAAVDGALAAALRGIVSRWLAGRQTS